MPPKTYSKTIRNINLSEAAAAWVNMEARRRGLSRAACVTALIEDAAAGKHANTADSLNELTLQLHHWLQALFYLRRDAKDGSEIENFCHEQMTLFHSLRDVALHRYVEPSGILLEETKRLAQEALRKLEEGNVTAAKLRLKDIVSLAETQTTAGPSSK